MRIVLALLCLGACTSDDPVDISGSYSVNTTNGQNDCGFANWEVGAQAQGVGITVLQTDQQFTAEPTDPVLIVVLELLLGNHIFAGEVAGATFHGTLAGSNVLMEEGEQCAFRVNADLDGSLSRDTITGTLTYRVVIVTSASDCPPSNCTTVADFNGTRPPQ